MEAISSRAWLAAFLDRRDLADGPDGRALFAYQADRDEYVDLATHVRTTARSGTGPSGDRAWQACFCLLVSEFYRRDYPGRSGWSWNDAERSAGLALTAELRASAVR